MKSESTELITIITGTRKGLGKALAEHLLGKGHQVVGCSRREGTIEHENYEHFRVDVSDETSVRKMIRAIVKKWGRIDVLLNNAGMASMNHLLLTPTRTVEKVFNTNFLGTFLFIREVAKKMQKKKFGRIVNYTTVAVPLDLEGEAVYAASKAAVESLTKVAAKELGGFNITVNAIGPTPVATDLIKNVPENKIQELLEQQSVKRMGTEEDVINVVDFFIKPESEFINGQIIYLGGVN